MKTIFLSSVVWLLSAHVCHANDLSRELTELDAQIQDMRSDLPYQTGDMVWQNIYREGKQVVMVYQDVSKSSTRADFDAAQLRQDMAPALCHQSDSRRYLQAGIVYVTQIQFKHSAPLRLSLTLADCVDAMH